MLAYVSKATINRRLEIWLSWYSRVAFRCGTFILQNRPIQIIFTTVRLLSKERKKKRGGGGEKILSINFVVLEERRKGEVFGRAALKAKANRQIYTRHSRAGQESNFPNALIRSKAAHDGDAEEWRESKLHGWTRERESPCRSGAHRCFPGNRKQACLIFYTVHIQVIQPLSRPSRCIWINFTPEK